MTENPQQSDPDVPHDDELDIEGPNESTQPSDALDADEESQDQS